jgi:hypothetical protein
MGNSGSRNREQPLAQPHYSSTVYTVGPQQQQVCLSVCVRCSQTVGALEQRRTSFSLPAAPKPWSLARQQLYPMARNAATTCASSECEEGLVCACVVYANVCSFVCPTNTCFLFLSAYLSASYMDLQVLFCLSR